MDRTNLFRAITGDIRYTGNSILHETEELATETDTRLTSLQNTCRDLPPSLYASLEIVLPFWKALLERSDEERTRLGNLLIFTAQAIEDTEQRIIAQETIIPSRS